MSEDGRSNLELALQLTEEKNRPLTAGTEVVEIIEAIVLALVAVATAWSGYQAALWSGQQAELYGKAAKVRIQATRFETAANQERLYTAGTVAEWIKAEARGDKKLAEIFERRLLPEFRPGFEAWKKTDPLNNPKAPAGPFTEEYRTSRMEEAIKLNNTGDEIFAQGNSAREHSDDYIKATVTLATVLLLTAISQRFKIRGVRVGLVLLATLLLCITIYRISTLQRL